jgi:hypothetical protein
MHYLIDGHNLIARMPDIDLSDPDDEAQLMMRLRQWVAGNRRRRVTLYFDGGLPGGRAPHFSGGKVEVIFASYGEPADDLLIRKIRRVQNPPEYTLVTSDAEIVGAATRRHMPVIDADTFAAQLEHDVAARQTPPPTPDVDEAPLLSEEDVQMWLDLFGPEPDTSPQEKKPRRRRRKARPSAAAPAPKAASREKKQKPQPARPADQLKDSGEPLTDDEVAAWMALFGREPDAAQVRQVREAARVARAQRRQEKREKRAPARDADQLKETGSKLTEDEVDEWLDIFNDPDV